MHFGPTFYRATAVASFASAATTLALIFLPLAFAPAEGFEGRMARVFDPAYVWRSWVYFAHPFVTFAAALGVAVRLRRDDSGAALVGVLGFHCWALTEAMQQVMTLFAFDRWRAAYASADAALRESLPAQVAMYDGLWDAMFFLLLVGFLIGNVAYASALVRKAGLSRIVGMFYVAAALITAHGIAREFGAPALPAPLDFWLYPAIQPLGRVLIGVWLWRHAIEPRSLAAPAS